MWSVVSMASNVGYGALPVAATTAMQSIGSWRVAFVLPGIAAACFGLAVPGLLRDSPRHAVRPLRSPPGAWVVGCGHSLRDCLCLQGAEHGSGRQQRPQRRERAAAPKPRDAQQATRWWAVLGETAAGVSVPGKYSSPHPQNPHLVLRILSASSPSPHPHPILTSSSPHLTSSSPHHVMTGAGGDVPLAGLSGYRLPVLCLPRPGHLGRCLARGGAGFNPCPGHVLVRTPGSIQCAPTKPLSGYIFAAPCRVCLPLI